VYGLPNLHLLNGPAKVSNEKESGKINIHESKEKQQQELNEAEQEAAEMGQEEKEEGSHGP